MWDVVEGIHKALRIESTWAFVLIIAFGAAIVGGFFAWIIDTGYKNSPEYKTEHSGKLAAPTSDLHNESSQGMSSQEFAKTLAEELGKQINKQIPQNQPDLSTQALPLSGGFVQYESKSVVAESQEWVNRWEAGKVLRFKYIFANRGNRPVMDNQTWGTLVVVDPQKNPGVQLRSVLLKGVNDGYEKYKGSGNSLGVGLTGWNYAVGPPLTKDEVDGILAGKLRIHLMLSGAWTDELGKRYYWTHCEFTNWGEVSLDQSFWHDC